MGKEIGKYDIADRILNKIMEKGMTIKDFADKINVSPWSMYNYIEARCVPRSKKLYKIAKGLNVTMEWLLHGEQDV